MGFYIGCNIIVTFRKIEKRDLNYLGNFCLLCLPGPEKSWKIIVYGAPKCLTANGLRGNNKKFFGVNNKNPLFPLCFRFWGFFETLLAKGFKRLSEKFSEIIVYFVYCLPGRTFLNFRPSPILFFGKIIVYFVYRALNY